MGERQPGDPAPYFDFHIFVCVNRRPEFHARGSCAARGSEKLRDYMKVRAKELGVKRVRVNTAMCLDRCEHGPCIVVYPEGIWYRVSNEKDVDAVLEGHVKRGLRLHDLMLPE
jgi:(2Fe-2S) ferredoxin